MYLFAHYVCPAVLKRVHALLAVCMPHTHV